MAFQFKCMGLKHYFNILFHQNNVLKLSTAVAVCIKKLPRSLVQMETNTYWFFQNLTHQFSIYSYRISSYHSQSPVVWWKITSPRHLASFLLTRRLARLPQFHSVGDVLCMKYRFHLNFGTFNRLVLVPLCSDICLWNLGNMGSLGVNALHLGLERLW